MTRPTRLRSVAMLAMAGALAWATPPADAANRKPKGARAGSVAKVASPSTGPSYAGRKEVADFAAEVASRRGWDAAWVERSLAQARQIPLVRRLVMPAPAGTAKNWGAYRDRFIDRSRVEAGVRFWRTNEHWLDLAEQRYGVPPEIVVGIVGVETFYGRIMGDFRILDALSTLAFDFPAGRRDRTPFFRAELEELLAMALREGTDPASIRGSFAGAMGLPQFMPGSVNRHAVDFDGNGRIDLRTSGADVVGSVASYLAAHGWQRGMPTHYDVAVPVDSTDRATLLAPDILPTFSAAQFADHGAELDPAGKSHAGPLALVELQNGDAAPSYVAGTQNFYAVTRYNWSSYYALAVIELGEAVARARRAQ